MNRVVKRTLTGAALLSSRLFVDFVVVIRILVIRSAQLANELIPRIEIDEDAIEFRIPTLPPLRTETVPSPDSPRSVFSV